MRSALLALLAVGCGEDREAEPEPRPPSPVIDARLPMTGLAEDKPSEACYTPGECPHGFCVVGRCVSHKPSGSPCDSSLECEWGCADNICMSESQARALYLASLGKETSTPAPTAPRAPAPELVERPDPVGPGSRTRVVTETERKARAVSAHCGGDERLIGGGCETAFGVMASHPIDHGSRDAVGAGWTCTTRSPQRISAYALCAPLR